MNGTTWMFGFVRRGCIALLALIGFVLSVAPSLAEPMSCDAAAEAVSTDGGAAVTLRIRNDGDDPVSFVWINLEGGKRPSGSIAPHAVRWERSYVGHVFALETLKGDCVCAMRMTAPTHWTRGTSECQESPLGAFEPTSSYDVETVEGWRVLVSSAFKDRAAERKAAMDALQEDLAKIRRGLIPQPAVKLLQKTKIWLELTDDILPDRAAYHPYLDYLVAAGYNPDKVRSVQFTARSLDVRKGRQPAVVLHELAHAFHDQALGYDDPDILAAYFRACADTRLYTVERDAGRPERHYGLNDQTEFFAEFTEATFWANDWPPKTRGALDTFDKSIAPLIERSWRKPRAANVHLGVGHQVCPVK
jgi:hypothetical protein